MLCNEFLERHSEFRDGLITSSRELRRFSRHLAHCAVCRRYDVTIRKAVLALHSATPITASADFRDPQCDHGWLRSRSSVLRLARNGFLPTN